MLHLHNNSDEAVSMLGISNFANDAINLMYGTDFDNKTREYILNKIDIFLENVEEGKEILSTGKLTGNAMQAIDAYEFTYDFARYIPKKEFETIVQDLRNDLEALKSKKGFKNGELTTLMSFFKSVRKNALSKVDSPVLY